MIKQFISLGINDRDADEDLWVCSIWMYVFLISDSKTSQTDEEKQRERQRNEREQKNAEQDAINYRVRNGEYKGAQRSRQDFPPE